MPLSRLVKTRSNVNVAQLKETMDDERPPRQSIADLHTRRVVATQRQLLPRQLSDTCAESVRSSTFPLYRAVSSSELNGSANVSPVTPKASIDAVRPLGAPTDRLDIEQAITLLQELKKTASPEELVSLHRALLPVKGVSPVYSPQVASVDDLIFSGLVPPERRRSVMPPGLATRSGLSEDVLRRPQYSATVQTPSRQPREICIPFRERREMWLRAAQRDAGGVYGQTFARPETPSEQPNTGSYHAGTLRITNGAASPDSSIISRIAAAADLSEEDKLGADVDDDHIQQPERSRPSGPRPPQRQTQGNARTETAERQRSRSASKSSLKARQCSLDNVVSHSASPSGSRSQQCGSQHAAHLSQQYLIDCEISESPFDERTAHLELVKPLSSVRSAESGYPGRQSDPYAGATFKLTNAAIPTVDAENARSNASEALGLRSDGLTALAIPQPQIPGREPNHQASTNETLLSQVNTSMYNLEDILTDARANATTDAPLANSEAKRTSPLSFFKARQKVPKKSSSAMFENEMLNAATSMHSPLHGSDVELVRQTKRLQKRVPESVRRQRQLEAEKQVTIDEGLGSVVADEITTSTAGEGISHSAVHKVAHSTAPDATDDDHHRLRLRGKSFGRKRSKTSFSEHSTETVLHTPAFRTRVRRSVSASRHLLKLTDGSHGTNCMSSPEQKPHYSEQLSPDFEFVVARDVSFNPPYSFTDDNRSIPWSKSMQHRHLPEQAIAQVSHALSLAPRDIPQKVPMPKAPPLATLGGNQRVIPIGGHGSVEDLFPEWQSRPAASPPQSTPSPSHLQVRQSYKPRRPLNISSIPPLPELPADIESKVTRADQMVAKKMMNSPQNSARNSPQPSMRNSVDFTSNLRKTPAGRVAHLQRDVSEHSDLGRAGEPARWSIDGSIVLQPAARKSQPASPTHDSQHPGWPGWEKQAEMWRQRKIGLDRALKKSVDMRGKAPVARESSPPSPSIVVSRYITPPVSDNAKNAQQVMEKTSKAEKLTEAYHQLFADDKENWLTQPNMQRTDSVDSSATCGTASSEGREAKVDLSRTGSAYSNASSIATAASSNTSTGVSPSPLVEMKAAHARPQSYTPYRPAEAVRAERSQALSLARRACVSTPQNSSASVPDRYSGGLGYGWDRSTGFAGSAGTRSSATGAANRKSVKISEDYGLDLSDVPVFLRKVQTGS